MRTVASELFMTASIPGPGSSTQMYIFILGFRELFQVVVVV